MPLPNLDEVIRTYLYGANFLPSSFVDPSLMRSEVETASITGVSSEEFMAGPGRFAVANLFEAVDQFFGTTSGYDVSQLFAGVTGSEVRMSKQAWCQGILGLTTNSLSIDQKDFDDGQDNYAERVYVWGNTAFQISDDAEFVVTRTLNVDGTYTYTRMIENFAVIPRLGIGENFDFVSSDGTTTQTQAVSQHAVDPSGIGRKVVFNFVDDVQRTTFGQADYLDGASLNELGFSPFESSIVRQLHLQNGTQQIFDSLFNSGITATIHQGKLVVYGTNDSDVFEGWTTIAGHNLLQQYTNVGPYSFLMPQFSEALNGLVYLSGNGNDTVNGTARDDIILDGNGADRYVGHQGFDLLSYAESSSGVQIDLSTGFATGGTANGDSVAQIEAILGTSDADSFTASGIVVEMFAGGSGNDTFNITASIGSPTIIWGGGGADTINVTTGTNQADGPAGVLMVNVAGLTEENFHLFDIEQLGLGSDFDWGQIDVVIVNPEAADKIFVDGQELTVTNDATVEVYDDVAIDFGIVDGDSSLTPYLSALLAAYQGAGYEIFSDQVITPTEPGVEGTMLPFRRIDLRYNAEISINALAWDSGYGIEHVYNFTEGFLGGTTGLSLVAASGGQFWEARTEIEGIEVPDLFQFPFPMSEGHTGNTVNFAYTDPYGYEFTWVETTHYFLSGWNGNPNGLDAAPVYLGATSSTEALEFTSPDALGNWFVVGGQFAGGNLTSDGSITYVMPDQEDGSGSGSGSGGGTPPPPRGGSYHNSSGASNLGGGEETRRLTNFNASQDTVVISGVALNGSNLASGVTAYESNGSTIIAYGTDDNVVLRGVTLAQWQAGAAGQLLGGAGADSLTGTGGANVFAGGGGADTISAGTGNDRINYASGDDVILGHLSNAGTDTLDLRRFSASDVTFRVSGQDVLISTADGTIRLGSQIQYDLGNARSNIETILFSNGNLTETDIRARAVSDQATDGNDSITGTAFADAINGLAGNDTINASGGNDTISFSGGHDVILGHLSNAGSDTLDLRQYMASEVSFRVSGQDVLVTTADGTITLGSQLQYAVGNARSNIETVVFSNGSLTEAGIMARAVSDQATGGNDSIIGTASADVINGLSGSDTLSGFAGNDTFGFTSGDDVIIGHLSNFGADTLDLTQFSASGATFRVSGFDVLVTTAQGTIWLESQVRYSTGHERSNIETILFSNGTLNEAAIRARAVSDQATAGANTITGTGQADIIRGLAGNDTITGGAGADVFVFAGGDGADRITDFSRSSGDVFRFYGLTYGDLTISQSGSNAVVNYGSGNVLTLASVTASTLTAAAFEFL